MKNDGDNLRDNQRLGKNDLESRRKSQDFFQKSPCLENIGFRTILLGNWIAGFRGKVDGN